MKVIELEVLWTAKHLLKARDHEFRQFINTPFGFFTNCFAALGTYSSWLIFLSSFNIIVFIFTTLGIYWFLNLINTQSDPLGHNFKNFNRLFFDTKWIIDEKQITIDCGDLFQFTFSWSSFFKITQAPEGFWLYLTHKHAYCLLNDEFSSESDYQLFAEFARAKVKNFGEAGFLERELLRLCFTEPEQATVAPLIQDLGMTDLEYAALVAQGRDPVQEQLYPNRRPGPAPDS